LANTAVVYDRSYEDQELNFETSGGLLHNSLVLQDKETDSYWSIIQGASIAGEFADTALKELPFGTKVQWREWVELHPETRVLSVDGREHYPVNTYEQYLNSDATFGERLVEDQRLAPKDSVFGFVWNEGSYVVPLSLCEGGAVFEIGSVHVFLFRPRGSPVLRSTAAYISSSGSFERASDVWTHSSSGAGFDPELGLFEGPNAPGLKRMVGIDTFWYIWIPLHPLTTILDHPSVR
jgi:hypothetical protein